jgi:16S rRNA (guanine966-N2)-methyltransferase
MRQALFNSLAVRIPGSRVLDLFAGSGAYGLEALSRGAAHATFVERNRRALACLRQNLIVVCKSLSRPPAEAATLQPVDVLSFFSPDVPPPDLVFIDPPYEQIEALAPALFTRLAEILAPVNDPLIAFEMPGEISLSPKGWSCAKRLGKGAHQPSIAIFRRD